MSNNPEDFEKLRQALKLKQFEVPPPGYFENFSTQVIYKIKSQRSERGAFHEVPWLQRMFSALESSPLFAGAFGIIVCGALIAGVAYSTYTPIEDNNLNTAANGGLNIADLGSQSFTAAVPSGNSGSGVAPSIAPLFNTNLAASFGNSSQFNVQPVNFSTGH